MLYKVRPKSMTVLQLAIQGGAGVFGQISGCLGPGFAGAQNGVGGRVDLLLGDATSHAMVSSIGALPLP
ncbi:hypothetical protein [Dyella sp. OK004]|uniref:hypothetical protein n=1 Tax=Dyella sp. OK004 TaxID=1855292 RepID=UPI000B86207F|nr:hypothetical protein [Dyella sp. OK004]